MDNKSSSENMEEHPYYERFKEIQQYVLDSNIIYSCEETLHICNWLLRYINKAPSEVRQDSLFKNQVMSCLFSLQLHNIDVEKKRSKYPHCTILKELVTAYAQWELEQLNVNDEHIVHSRIINVLTSVIQDRKFLRDRPKYQKFIMEVIAKVPNANRARDVLLSQVLEECQVKQSVDKYIGVVLTETTIIDPVVMALAKVGDYATESTDSDTASHDCHEDDEELKKCRKALYGNHYKKLLRQRKFDEQRKQKLLEPYEVTDVIVIDDSSLPNSPNSQENISSSSCYPLDTTPTKTNTVNTTTINVENPAEGTNIENTSRSIGVDLSCIDRKEDTRTSKFEGSLRKGSEQENLVSSNSADCQVTNESSRLSICEEVDEMSSGPVTNRIERVLELPATEEVISCGDDFSTQSIVYEVNSNANAESSSVNVIENYTIYDKPTPIGTNGTLIDSCDRVDICSSSYIEQFKKKSDEAIAVLNRPKEPEHFPEITEDTKEVAKTLLELEERAVIKKYGQPVSDEFNATSSEYKNDQSEKRNNSKDTNEVCHKDENERNQISLAINEGEYHMQETYNSADFDYAEDSCQSQNVKWMVSNKNSKYLSKACDEENVNNAGEPKSDQVHDANTFNELVGHCQDKELKTSDIGSAGTRFDEGQTTCTFAVTNILQPITEKQHIINVDETAAFKNKNKQVEVEEPKSHKTQPDKTPKCTRIGEIEIKQSTKKQIDNPQSRTGSSHNRILETFDMIEKRGCDTDEDELNDKTSNLCDNKNDSLQIYDSVMQNDGLLNIASMEVNEKDYLSAGSTNICNQDISDEVYTSKIGDIVLKQLFYIKFNNAKSSNKRKSVEKMDTLLTNTPCKRLKSIEFTSKTDIMELNNTTDTAQPENTSDCEEEMAFEDCSVNLSALYSATLSKEIQENSQGSDETSGKIHKEAASNGLLETESDFIPVESKDELAVVDNERYSNSLSISDNDRENNSPIRIQDPENCHIEFDKILT